jgi:RNA polymerase sigma factor (sigma-70 family)
MANLASRSVVRQIGSLFDGGSVAGLSDRQLLERFVAQQDAAGEAAFAALVSRHGPMVLDVCGQILGDRHHAEDAFQAVFLVLARRARSIRDPDLLGNWLYGVASRTARCAKLQLARRRRKEGDTMRRPGPSSPVVVEPMIQPAERLAIDREQAEALHDEIDRLPKSFRQPVVLCYFEGLTLDEAARTLRCPAGTVGSRLARARDKLRRGLTRRGVVLPAGALVTALAHRSASASVSSPLCDITTRAAMNIAAGQTAAGATSAVAMALAREVLRSMLLSKLRFLAMSFLFLGAAATGAGYWKYSLAMEDDPVKNPASHTTQHEASAKPRDEDQPYPATKSNAAKPGRMFVSGRVLDPEGKPIRGAALDLVARPRKAWVGASADDGHFSLFGFGQSDASGRFHLDVPRTSSVGFHNHSGSFDLMALAAAPGFGVGWAELNPDAQQPGGDIRLRPEQTVHVKLVDLRGLPAAGVEVHIQSIGRETPERTWDGVSLWPTPPEGLRAWPRTGATDDQGKLVLSGIGEDLTVRLTVHDLRYARQDLSIETGRQAAKKDKERTIVLEPATIIEGRVITADTGQPVPHAVIAVAASRNQLGGMVNFRYRADDQGRFTANPFPGSYFHVRAFAPDGRPYLVPEVEFAWAKGAIKKVVDIKLPRGILIRGKVTEENTGRLVGNASVQYIPARSRDDVLSGWQAIVASKDDGSYQITVPPGKGHLLVFGPTPDYVLKMIGANMLYNSQPGGQRYYAHAIIPYEANASDQPHEISASLRAGATIQGHIEGPDGQRVTNASLLTTLRIEPTNPFWRGGYQIPVRDGRFEVHGLAAEASTQIFVFDDDRQWGAAVELAGKQAGEDLIIRLQPCGQAKARFVGPDGKPVAKYQPHFELIATPGPTRFSRSKREQVELSANAELMGNVDRKHYWNGPHTDVDGRITLPALIPGALYRIVDFSTINDQDKGVQIRKDFTVKPGETLDLDDIVIEKPQQ